VSDSFGEKLKEVFQEPAGPTMKVIKTEITAALIFYYGSKWLHY
jgi:hypothetical protein